MPLLWSVPLTLAAAYAALLLLLWFAQEKLIFLPQKLAADHRFDFGADVHEAWVPREDGVRLHALHLKLPNADGVAFYLHGNAGNLEGWFSNADFWRRNNLDLFMLDYRGYGKSGGRIRSEAQLMDDVRAAWQHLVGTHGAAYAGKRRVVVGRSLGSALAARLAVEERPDLLVLISPYESLQALAAQHYPFVPGALLRYPLRTDEAVAQLAVPLLLVHGDNDEVIGIEHSQRLLARAPPAAGARLLRVRGAGHNDLQVFPEYLEGLRAAFTAAAPR
ncbi:MAG: alpha/beta fold hydrolase [Rubrivivax sp.]|nr:alpha/beta fold hydrolase [Rubrivivax sp.]